jgi:hypothetical protein
VKQDTPLVLPDGWLLISFLALVAHRVDGSCLECPRFDGHVVG